MLADLHRNRRSPGRTIALLTWCLLAVSSVAAPHPAGAEVTPPPTPFADWSTFVDRTYEYLLAAVPTPAERTEAVDALGAGDSTPGQFVAELRTRPDQVVNVDPTVRLYRAFFLRIPDAGGLQYWIAARRGAGWTLVRMADQFAGSSEFRTRYGALSNQAFVELVYANVLGRAADQGGLTYWTTQLDQRRRSRGSVMVGFSESNEYRGKQAAEVTASVLPVFLWGRSPAEPEFATWVALLEAGTPVVDLATTLLADPAFVARASKLRVAVIGDSVPNALVRQGAAGTDLQAYDVVNAGVRGCDGADQPPPARTAGGDLLEIDAACRTGWTVLYPPVLRFATDRAILMVGPHAMLDHQIDGTWRHPCHAPARTWYHDDILERLTYLQANATHVVVVLPAWPGPNSGWVMPPDRTRRADCVRAELRRAAADTGTPVVDLGAHLCTSPTTCNHERDTDGIHIDPDDAAEVLTWLLAATSPP